MRTGVSASALEFLILTAARTSEVLRASWSEINFATRTWTIPPERMKAGEEHRVPLSGPALRILERMSSSSGSDFIFPGTVPGKPLSNMSLLILLRRMSRDDLTAHGFRATFRTWASEKTTFQREVAEQALAHSIRSKVERAYQRGDLFEKRRSLMDAWARYCELRITPEQNPVIPMRRVN